PPDDSPDSQARARSLAEGAGTPMASLLEQALERAQGWEEVSAAVPSLQAAIVLQPTTETEVRLSHAAWALSVAVAAGHATAAGRRGVGGGGAAPEWPAERAPASRTAMGCGGAAPEWPAERAPASRTAMGCAGAAPAKRRRSERVAGTARNGRCGPAPGALPG